jgi:hypothetical protein
LDSVQAASIPLKLPLLEHLCYTQADFLKKEFVNMAEIKTKVNEIPVEAFLQTIEDDKTREDCQTLIQLMQECTGEPPKMWGAKIVGFGKLHYKYADGRDGEMINVGFSPRKGGLTLYSMGAIDDYDVLLKKLGKLGSQKGGKSCLYLNRLKDIDMATLKEIIQRTVEHRLKAYAS